VCKGVSWLAIGNIVNAACAWGRVALLARLGNAEMIGQLTLALAVCNPVRALADLGLSGALISDCNRQYRFRDYLSLRLLTCGLAMLVIVITAWASGYDPATARLVILAGLVVGSESVCDIFQAILQRREQMHWVAISLMIRGILGLTFFALGTWYTGDLAWGVCGFSLAAVATLLTIDIPRAIACERKQFGVENAMITPAWKVRRLTRGASHDASLAFRDNFDQFSCHDENGSDGLGNRAAVLLGLAWLSLPLGLATASLSLMTSIPRYWICHRLGNGALGGFAVAGSLMVAMSLVVGAMSQAASPRLARYHASKNMDSLVQLLLSLGLWLGAVTMVSLLIMALAGPSIIGLLFGPAYVPLAGVALCLTLAAGLGSFSIFLGRTICSMRRFRTSLLVRVVGIAVLVLLLPGWINWLGLMGAAWTLTLSWLVTVLLSLAAVLQEVRRSREYVAALAVNECITTRECHNERP